MIRTDHGRSENERTIGAINCFENYCAVLRPLQSCFIVQNVVY